MVTSIIQINFNYDSSDEPVLKLYLPFHRISVVHFLLFLVFNLLLIICNLGTEPKLLSDSQNIKRIINNRKIVYDFTGARFYDVEICSWIKWAYLDPINNTPSANCQKWAVSHTWSKISRLASIMHVLRYLDQEKVKRGVFGGDMVYLIMFIIPVVNAENRPALIGVIISCSLL